MSGWYDDLVIGRSVDIGTHGFEREEILRFASAYDPQSFHLDEEAARNGPFGALAASGWHTAAVCMGRIVRARAGYIAEGARRGLPASPKGPSPGFRDLRWLRPVLVGDTLRYIMTTTDKRATSRAGWGLAFNRCEAWNQHGEKVYDYMGSSFWPLKP